MKSRQKALSDILRDSSYTKFERSVFRAVAGIPCGEVRSYRWVAKAALSPRAYRAVGNVLNKNRYPGIIPCHRVIRSDGSIGGYAKGHARKKALLKAEGVDIRRAALI